MLIVMDAKTHAAIKRINQRQRTSGARARRASIPDKSAAVELVPATLQNGVDVLIALTPADPDRAHVLRRVDGRWRCACFTAKWSVAKTCAHEQAARERA